MSRGAAGLSDSPLADAHRAPLERAEARGLGELDNGAVIRVGPASREIDA